MFLIILYHYFLAHGLQYIVHYITHHKKCPLMFSKNHKLHHGNPIKITWYGQSRLIPNKLIHLLIYITYLLFYTFGIFIIFFMIQCSNIY